MDQKTWQRKAVKKWTLQGRGGFTETFEVVKGEGADKLSKRFSREEIKGILTVPARKEGDFTQAP